MAFDWPDYVSSITHPVGEGEGWIAWAYRGHKAFSVVADDGQNIKGVDARRLSDPASFEDYSASELERVDAALDALGLSRG